MKMLHVLAGGILGAGLTLFAFGSTLPADTKSDNARIATNDCLPEPEFLERWHRMANELVVWLGFSVTQYGAEYVFLHSQEGFGYQSH